jgi:hypothetical protein
VLGMGTLKRTAFLVPMAITMMLASPGIAAAETNPMRLAVSSCMFDALQLNSMMIMVDADTKKLSVAWECTGSSAQNLFEKLEMVAKQEVESGDGSRVSRQAGDGFVCVRYTGKALSHLGYRCYLSIPVTEPFAKSLNP